MSNFTGFKLKTQEKPTPLVRPNSSSVPPPGAKLPPGKVAPNLMPKHFGSTFSTKYSTEEE